MGRSWGAWRTQSSAADRGAFEARYPHPFLVVCDEIAAAKPSLVETERFPAIHQAAGPVQPTESSLVLPVVKADRSGNVFPDMITVGRARNNDLIVPDERVSSFHAYFSHDTGTWSLRDGASSNGTFVGGSRIDSVVELDEDAWIGLGAVQCRFLLPGPMHDALTGSA